MTVIQIINHFYNQLSLNKTSTLALFTKPSVGFNNFILPRMLCVVLTALFTRMKVMSPCLRILSRTSVEKAKPFLILNSSSYS